MNGTDAQSPDTQAPGRFARAKAWWMTAASVALVAAVALAIRWQGGAGQASAQAPVQTRPAPAARPQGAATQAAPTATSQSARMQAQSTAAAPAARPAPPATTSSVAPLNTKDLKVMAVVNGEQITRQQLGQECMRRFGKEVLESMVNRQLIAEACAQRNIQITEADVDAEIDRIAAKFGLSRDRWLMLLREERGFTDQQYRSEVVWPMLALRRVAADDIEVTQEELRKAFESEFGPKVRVRMIAVSSQAKAEQIRAAAVANPDSFGELAKKESEDPAVAAAYGVIPPVRRHVGDPNLEAHCFGLKPGGISPVIKVANMYYIVKCEEQIPQQYIASQHLPEIEQKLADRIRESKLRTAAMNFFEKMQNEAQIVNVYNDPVKQKEMPGVAALVNNRQISILQLSEECIARHGREVLDGEVNRKVLQQELNRRKLVVAENDIDAEVARAADQYGFLKPDGSPDVDRWLKEVTSQDGATVELYVRDAVWPSVALKKLVGNAVQVTDEDLKKGFESNYGERVEALAIVLGDQRQAQKVWEMARNNPTDAFFAELAEQYSIEPASRANGGKVPPIRRWGGSPQLEEEAFKLKPGELSGLVVVGDQYIILRCLGRTKPVQVDFESVKGELYKDIAEKKLRTLMAKEFDSLRERAQIDNFLAGTSQLGRPAAPQGNAGQAKAGVAPAGGARASTGDSQVRPATAVRPALPKNAVAPR
jgi:parvulin-like peptidyl-prolyl isomerase